MWPSSEYFYLNNEFFIQEMDVFLEIPSAGFLPSVNKPVDKKILKTKS